MKSFVAALAMMVCATGAAHAALLTSFGRTVNDGVYSIDAALADQIGLSGATHIGVLGLRSTTTPPGYQVGDTFDQTTLFNSTGNDGAIIGFLNGFNDSALDYTGAALEAVGTTEILAFQRASDQRIFEAVFFGFNTAGNIVFNGTSTFNAGQSRGDFGEAFDISVIPVPAALPLALLGLGGLGLYRRRRQRSAA